MKNALRWITGAVVLVFLLDVVVTAFWPHALVGTAGAARKIAGPFGTAVVAAIYFCRDMFVDPKASQIQQVKVKVEPKLEQNFEQKIEIKNDFSEFAKAMAEAQEMMAANATDDSGERSAQRYFITDAKGNRRGMFGVTDEGSAMLSMLSSRQKPMFIVTEAKGNSVMFLADEQGNLKASIVAGPGDASLALLDSCGVVRLAANVLPDNSVINLCGDDEEPRLILSLAPDAEPLIALRGLDSEGVFVSEKGLLGRDAKGEYFGVHGPEPSEEKKG